MYKIEIETKTRHGQTTKTTWTNGGMGFSAAMVAIKVEQIKKNPAVVNYEVRRMK